MTSIPSAISIATAKMPATEKRQRGASLFIALVALALMTIAGFSLMRSVNTGNIIAGNMAFKEVTVHAADLGIEAAAEYVNTLVQAASAGPDSDSPGGCAVASKSVLGSCRYSARTLIDDEFGVPRVDWSSIPENTTEGVTYQYVIDRQCNPDPKVVVNTGKLAKYESVKNICVSGVDTHKGSQGTDPSDASLTLPIYYRVTVRASGPRNTVSFVQALLMR